MKTALLGDKSFYKKILLIGLPVALQNLLVTSGSIVDTVMIGSLGELSVAAVGICAQYAALLVSAYYGFFNGGIIFFAQYWGAKNEKGISRAYGVTLSCMMVLGLLFGAAAVLAPEWILRVYTDKAAIREIAAPYLRILGFALPLQVFSFCLSGLMRSTEQVKVPLYASIAALLTNTFLNWVLIFGRFGLPAMGVRGAAIATVIGSAVNVVVLLAYCFFDKQRPFLLDVRAHFGWSASFIKKYFSKSLFIVANEIFMGIGFLVINIVVGRQNEMAIAALAVFRILENIVFSFFRGFSNASAVIVGKQIGAGEHVKGYTDGKRLALLCPIVIFIICIIQYALRGPLLGIFGLGAEAAGYAGQMLLVFIAAATFRASNWICNDSFRAGGESVFGTVVEIAFMYLFTIPAMLLTGLVFKLPFVAVFLCMYLDDYLRAPFIIMYMRSGKWVKPVTRQGQASLLAFQKLLGQHKKESRG